MVPYSLHSLPYSFGSGAGQTAPAPGAENAALDREVRADMAFLAADELQGRGSATRDEHIAALFAAAQFQALGLEPGGDNNSFVQRVALPSPLPASVQKKLSGFEDTPRTETWNAIGILRGSDSAGQVVLLTAHLDHLGIGPPNPAGDSIYNGADDDASGTTAVLALAHAFAAGPRPRRTVIFALFGSEELGGLGNAGFLAHPPVPLASIVANLEFEMIGRPDPAVPGDALWLTGYERSNLGPELAKHGAHLLPDPHPSENFFQRSDNIALARRGIIAQTVSSYGLHKDYHRPSDDLAKIVFNHLDSAIASMVDPIRWLAGTTWRPACNPGGKQ
jgi:Zn-dependent M28 family amino/carboxypeptidase